MLARREILNPEWRYQSRMFHYHPLSPSALGIEKVAELSRPLPIKAGQHETTASQTVVVLRLSYLDQNGTTES